MGTESTRQLHQSTQVRRVQGRLAKLVDQPESAVPNLLLRRAASEPAARRCAVAAERHSRNHLRLQQQPLRLVLDAEDDEREVLAHVGGDGRLDIAALYRVRFGTEP